MGKSKKGRLGFPEKQSLADQIIDGRVVKGKTRNKIRLRHDEDELVIDPKTTSKILRVAQKQRAELELEEFGPTPGEAKAAGLYDEKQKRNGFSDSDTDNEDEEERDYDENDFNDKLQLNIEDEKAIKMFENKNAVKGKTLAEIIMEKFAEKKAMVDDAFSDVGSVKVEDIDPRIKEMYEGVRDVMKRYRSGKVPKAFKIIPKLRNWEQILHITEPDNWSAAAMFQATRIFSSGLTQQMAQRFYNLVLLPRIRDDLAEYQKLNSYLYRALQKSLFKPAAFFKGIILPLLESGDCTLREAIIIGSTVANNSIPVLHSSACLLKICEMDYTAPNSIFMRLFFEKRYALPYRVVDAAVFHFLRFEQDKREMPTLWHHALLAFVQRYKNDVSSEQREALLRLLKKKSHYKITPEIRRELLAAHCRDIEQGESLANEESFDIRSDGMDLD
ncbi:bystin [Culicoides brevitarsis]|uniref:bystin n=1 Tax=Culicoides brevitarsis TaxID=469753 RepID=UPI00307C04FC